MANGAHWPSVVIAGEIAGGVELFGTMLKEPENPLRQMRGEPKRK
jgi:hypothetical protein